jgi:hypothetical protein
MTTQDTPEVVTDPVDGLINTGEPGDGTGQSEPTPDSTVFDVVERGGQDIPGGGTLVRLVNPEGSDRNLFFLRYSIFGVDFVFEIGDRARLNEVFGGLDAFDDVQTLRQGRFDQQVIEAGSVDEILGSTESLGSQIERGIRALGQEGIPLWLREDAAAMTLMVLAQQDGWSQQRLYTELAKTESVRTRFGDLKFIANRTGTDDALVNVTEFLRTEDAFRRELVRARGPNTDTSQEYLRGLVASGWEQAEFVELLDLERVLVENPEALANINEILAPQGQGTQLTADDFVTFLQEGRRSTREGFNPSEMFRSINDALRLTELEAAGITDLTRRQAVALGRGDPGEQIFDPTFFRDQAQQTAAILAANFNELEGEKLGLTRDDVVNFFLDGPDADPRTRQLVERFARDRGIAARGFDRPQSFVDAEGRLRVQGFADLTD